MFLFVVDGVDYSTVCGNRQHTERIIFASLARAPSAIYPVRRKTSSKRSVAKRHLGGAGELGRGYKAREPKALIWAVPVSTDQSVCEAQKALPRLSLPIDLSRDGSTVEQECRSGLSSGVRPGFSQCPFGDSSITITCCEGHVFVIQ